MRRGTSPRAASLLHAALILSVLLGTRPWTAHAAGYPDGAESGPPSAQTLHLHSGEEPRLGKPPGPGLTNHTLHAQVVVAGGGSSGVSAGLAAARNGANVVLIHGRPVLGGNSGSEIRLAMVGACGPRASDSNALRMECREGGIVEEYTLDQAATNVNRVPELFSLELYNKFRELPNATVLFNTWVSSVTKDSTTGAITAVIAEDQESQRRYIVSGDVFIDATGDGRLGSEAGAEFIMGREGPEQYNESLAEGPDGETEGSSLAFISREYDTPQTFVPPPWALKFNRSNFKYRSVHYGAQYGYWWNEVSWPYNTIADNGKIREDLYENLFGILDYIKNSGDIPGQENWGLDWFGSVPCKREGRRFIGQYVSTQNDIARDPSAFPPQEPELYPDRVAYSGWNFDLHNPKGIKDLDHPAYSSTRSPYMFSTPLRSLTSKDVPNLLFAGRLGSFSHVVFGSQRVMKTCSTMGQAAGTAAAYAVSTGTAPKDITGDAAAVWSVQQQLLRDDAFIIGLVNEDPRDLARTATASASSEQVSTTVNGSAANVLTGQTRAVVTDLAKSRSLTVGGVPPSQGIDGSNRWVSNGLPASLTLTLAEASTNLAQAQLVFDTGMHRKLTFSVKTGGVGHWHAQEETVRDYSIEVRDSGTGAWVPACAVTGNWQRRRVHALPCPPQPPAPPTPGPGPAASNLASAACDPTVTAQQWMLHRDDGTVRPATNGSMCISVQQGVKAAGGGHGNAVGVEPCTSPPSQLQTFNLPAAEAPSVMLQLKTPVPCANWTGQCGCVRVCTGCAPASVIESWPCDESKSLPGSQWTPLALPAASGEAAATVLATHTDSGQCLQMAATPTPHPQAAGAASRSVVHGPFAMPASVDAVRLNVTATNGVPDAHVMEVRLYGQDGVTPFPKPLLA